MFQNSEFRPPFGVPVLEEVYTIAALVCHEIVCTEHPVHGTEYLVRDMTIPGTTGGTGTKYLLVQ